ncbi:MAG: hypothetical protein JXQ87_18270 [Bacteroidia bacterium]
MEYPNPLDLSPEEATQKMLEYCSTYGALNNTSDELISFLYNAGYKLVNTKFENLQFHLEYLFKDRKKYFNANSSTGYYVIDELPTLGRVEKLRHLITYGKALLMDIDVKPVQFFRKDHFIEFKNQEIKVVELGKIGGDRVYENLESGRLFYNINLSLYGGHAWYWRNIEINYNI